MPNTGQATPLPHEEWLKKAGDDVQAEYERIREFALRPSGIQQSGHEAESVWQGLLEAWLPPGYRIGVRKYLIFETPVDGRWQSRETDLIVFHPAYPEALRSRPQVLISGVVAAFSVKLTLDRRAISEAVTDAATLRRGVAVDLDRKVGNIVSPLIFGVLAHSHRGLGDPPDRTVDTFLQQASRDAVAPRENLDLMCIADSNCWSRLVTVHTPFPPGHPLRGISDPGEQPAFGETYYSIGPCSQRNYPVAALVGGLWALLAQRDETLRRIADGLWTPTDMGGATVLRPLSDVVEPGGSLYQKLVSQPGPTML